MSPWSDRLYQSLILSSSLRRQRWPRSDRDVRRLLRRILGSPLPDFASAADGGGPRLGFGYGFEREPPVVAKLSSPWQQAVLVAWPAGPTGHLSPGALRAALVGNFVLLINRAFGHRADAVASLSAAAAARAEAEDACRRRLLSDIVLLRLQNCRLELEDCYAREAPRLAQVLRGLTHPVPGSDAWCERRLSDLLATLARAERSNCNRLHWIAGPDEAERLAQLCAGLRQLGYPALACPKPWPLHVDVGPVTLENDRDGRRPAVGPRPSELLRLCGSRDALLLQLLAPARSRSVALAPPSPAATMPGYLVEALARWRARLAADACAAGFVDSFDGFAEDAENDSRDAGDAWSQLELVLARHLADYPVAVGAAYVSYEPRPIAAHLAGVLRLLDALAGAAAADGRRRLGPLAAAGLRVADSACAVLGLAPLRSRVAGSVTR